MFLNISLLADHRYSKTVAYYCKKMILHLFLFLYFNIYFKNKLFIPVIENLNFQQSLRQSLVSHDPSEEISPICWFAAQETVLIIITVGNNC